MVAIRHKAGNSLDMASKLCKCRQQVKDCGLPGGPILFHSMKGNKKPIKYQDAGVSIDRGNRLVERIKKAAKDTGTPGVMGNLGGFGGLFDLAACEYRDPVLVAGTDGVGTKIRLAIDMNRHDTIGIDLVAMCANDLVVQGAAPLFFLDYFACSRLDVDTAATVIEGIAYGCKQANCALIGGETAEMPGMYAEGDYDLAGFCVGAVERNQIITGERVEAGNMLIGLSSSGPHSNGYSLIRKVLEISGASMNQSFGDTTLGDVLLQPTRIYVTSLLQLIAELPVQSIAHITGGGIMENLPRVLPKELAAVIDTDSWEQPSVFRWVQESGNIEPQEMYRTFNCGIGMVVCVGENRADEAIRLLASAGETAMIIGTVVKRTKKTPSVTLEGL